MKTILNTRSNPAGHWVGDGFPVRSLFTYDDDVSRTSPFLLLDYAGPHTFASTSARRMNSTESPRTVSISSRS